MARNSEPIRAFVVHWNQSEACAATVAALSAQASPLTATVLDNASAPDAYQELRGKIGSKIDIMRLSENKGWGPALNIALRGWLDSEQSRYCLIAAHDASLAPDCISLLVEAMDREARIGIACPQYSDCVVPRLSVLHGVQMNVDVAKARLTNLTSPMGMSTSSAPALFVADGRSGSSGAHSSLTRKPRRRVRGVIIFLPATLCSSCAPATAVRPPCFGRSLS